MRHLFSFCICALMFSLKAFSCEMESPHRHTNPDGTQGGLVSKGAKVEASVYIGFNAKICDQAWVDGNAKILDLATIRENSWVREFSIVKDRAVIAGDAVVWGSQTSLAEVSGDSRVYGSARILSGTKISGRAQVYGSPILEDSTVSGEAKVCLGTRIADERIENDYFCNPSFTVSKVSLKLVNLDESSFNLLRDSVIVEADDDFFEDERFFTVLINNEAVPNENISVFRNRLNISHGGLLKDGLNTISFSGKDRLGKEIDSKEYNVIVGSSSKTISLNTSGTVRVEAIAHIEGQNYKVPTMINGSTARLQGLPVDGVSYALTIKAVSDSGYFIDSFNSDAIPSSIDLVSFPKFTNNSGDLSTGLNFWTVSHPSNVVTTNDGVKITFEGDETVELSKTFSLSPQNASLSFEVLSAVQPSLFDSGLEVEMIFISQTSKKIQIDSPTLSDLTVLADIQKGIRYGYSAPTQGADKVTFLIRLRNKLKNFRVPQDVTLKNGGPKNVDVYFTPKSMSVINRSEAVPEDATAAQIVAMFSRDISVPLENVDCSSTGFRVSNATIFEPSIDTMEFLSAGYTPSMPNYSENRIYGNLSFKNLKRENISELRLVVRQFDRVTGQVHLVKKPLSPCMLERFNDPQITPPNSIVSFTPELNLSRPLFSIGANELRNIGSDRGQLAVMYIEADVITTSGTETIESKPSALTVLTSPWGDGSYTYGDVDEYDSIAPGIVRTGGDKWILPAYGDILMTIVNNAPQIPVKWRFGDLSKLNGGQFLGHDTHRDGRDADIKFDDQVIDNVGTLKFNFTALGTDDDLWDTFLDEFDRFLSSFKSSFRYIRDIYISHTQKANATKYLNVRYANRCFENLRFIQFQRGSGQRSLLRNVKNHWHHAHIRFNEADTFSGQAVAYNLDNPPTNDLDEFYFQLGADGNNLSVTPIKPTDFTNKYLLWRFQSVAGYENFGMSLELGPQGTIQNKSKFTIQKSDLEIKRHIIVTVADKATGACVQREIEIDPTKAANLRKWTYIRKGDSYQMVEAQ